eukprot:TRINITY_DN5974_c0_g1_i5.p1 TRINITY_DN5974_c0_g1~~TRINITY_DN5974_c0_g1_i5.p1  ORF type:complete len:164 (-),score=25.74 TRINITY_DN5974_c0_g1_i5:189-680(-)
MRPVEDVIREDIKRDPSVLPEERDKIFANTMACHYLVQNLLQQHMKSWCRTQRSNLDQCTQDQKISPQKVGFDRNSKGPCVKERNAMFSCFDRSLGDQMAKELEPYFDDCANNCAGYDVCYEKNSHNLEMCFKQQLECQSCMARLYLSSKGDLPELARAVNRE